MNVIELLVFLLFCAGLGFLGSLASHRYGWIAGVLPAAVLLLVTLFFTWRNLILEIREKWNRRHALR